jgi:hypothetical protein
MEKDGIVLITFIGLFFACTGAYAIISALNQMGSKSQSDSTLDTKFFKFNAPVGFTYGIVALGLVFGIIKFYNIGSQKDQIKSLNEKIIDLEQMNSKLHLNQTPNTTSLIRETFSYYEPKSIFGGKVLVEAHNAGEKGGQSLIFSGIIGTCENKKGPFSSMTIDTDKGKRLYFMTSDSLVWGVNTINNGGGLTLEIYKEN